MSITSAMFTGVSGLLANAEGINVIGNNLANVNTVGFKSGRMLFSDMLSVEIGGGSQIGRGSMIQKVDNVFGQGSFESTETVTDLAIQGNSFFALKAPGDSAPVTQNQAYVSRAGAFRTDADLYLVNADGYQLLDTQGNPIKFNDNASGIATAVAALSPLLTTLQSSVNTLDTRAGQLVAAADSAITTASDAADYRAVLTQINEKAGNLLTDATGLKNTANANGTASEQLLASNIQLAADAAKRATQAAVDNPKDPTLGAAAISSLNSLSTLINAASFSTETVNTDFTTLKSRLNDDPTLSTLASTYSTQVNPLKMALTDQANANALKEATRSALNATGLAISSPQSTSLSNNALSTLADTNNLIKATSFQTASVVTAYTNLTADIPATETAAAGAAPAIAILAGEIGKGFEKIVTIGSDGLITYVGKDGTTTNYYNVSGQVGIATTKENALSAQRLAVISVPNANALQKTGGTLFKATVESGISDKGFTLLNNSLNGSSEKVFSNSLEQSNVDMAAQFVKMILTQRAYSANSKTITTADEMTQEVLNLKR